VTPQPGLGFQLVATQPDERQAVLQYEYSLNNDKKIGCLQTAIRLLLQSNMPRIAMLFWCSDAHQTHTSH